MIYSLFVTLKKIQSTLSLPVNYVKRKILFFAENSLPFMEMKKKFIYEYEWVSDKKSYTCRLLEIIVYFCLNVQQYYALNYYF